jgi:hypothetical protein
MRELSAESWERFLADGDGLALLARLCPLSTRRPPGEVSYPEYHRVCDIELDGRAYRVNRLVDLDDGEERLFIEPTDAPDLLRPGVPYWLRGAALAEWVRQEAACLADDEVDWEWYRSG